MKKTLLNFVNFMAFLSGGYLHAQSYTAIDLGTFGGTYGVATSINNAGQVVGYANTTDDLSSYAFVTTGGPLQIVGRVYTAGGYSEAYGINEAGEIVGRATFDHPDEQNGVFPVLYSGGQTQRLGSDRNLFNGLARAINSGGIAVGDYQPNSSPRALRLTTDSGSELTALGGGFDIAYGINDAGTIVGFARAPESGESRGFVTDGTTGITRALPGLGGSGSTARAINDSGQIAGSGKLANGLSHAAIFTNGVAKDLNPGNTPSSEAFGINNQGEVVGVVYKNYLEGFVYKNGSFQSLTSLSGIIITAVNDINDFGQIAAVGQTNGSLPHPILLNPTTPMETSNGQTRNARVVAGVNFGDTATQVGTGGFFTVSKLLDGTASANRSVTTVIDNSVHLGLASDVINITGTGSDVFVLQLSYNESAAISLFGSEADVRLGWYDPSDGKWKNAVYGNTPSTEFFAGDGAYDSSTDLQLLQLGTYGVDTVNNTVWAVINHNSEFGAIDAVPEPSTYLLFGLGAWALVAFRRRPAAPALILARTPAAGLFKVPGSK